jgi:hypothetical protein
MKPIYTDFTKYPSNMIDVVKNLSRLRIALSHAKLGDNVDRIITQALTLQD